jgi:hypothetical protein
MSEQDRTGGCKNIRHERKLVNDIKASPFVLSYVEGLREGFSVIYYAWTMVFLKFADGARSS